jgi:hypothetical protein
MEGTAELLFPLKHSAFQAHKEKPQVWLILHIHSGLNPAFSPVNVTAKQQLW